MPATATLTAPKTTKTRNAKAKTPKRKVYTAEQLARACSKPISERKALPIGRNGADRIPRNFYLSDADVARFKAEVEKDATAIPNPHNKTAYYFIWEALKSFGPMTHVTVARAYNKFKELGSDPSTKDDNGKTFYQRYKNKAPRSEDNALDAEGRFMQNVRVLQRVTGNHPYGNPMKEIGTKVLGTKGVVIDVIRGGSGGHLTMLRLNTDSATPIKDYRKVAAPAAESKAAPTATDSAPAEAPAAVAAKSA